MATKTGYRQNSVQVNGGNSNNNGNPVGLDNNSGDDSFYVIVIIVLLVIILFFMPVLMWMYVDIRQTEIKVQKLVKKLENK